MTQFPFSIESTNNLAGSCKISLILFDLGGVLLDFGGAEVLAQYFVPRISEEEMWKKWLHAPSVRAYETGLGTLDGVAEVIGEELGITISPDVFLAHYDSWYRGIYPDARALLHALKTTHTLGLLSNINDRYWARIAQEPDLLEHFTFVFASHQMGAVKPDRRIYEMVLEQTNLPAEQILFLDDNQVNVLAARAMGMNSMRAVGVPGVIDALQTVGIL